MICRFSPLSVWFYDHLQSPKNLAHLDETRQNAQRLYSQRVLCVGVAFHNYVGVLQTENMFRSQGGSSTF